MDGVQPTSVICRFCLKPMQEGEVVVKDNVVVTRSFVCACRGVVHWVNVHAAQQKKQESA
jgi:hypothetical protein